jgi:hypothetical protein
MSTPMKRTVLIAAVLTSRITAAQTGSNVSGVVWDSIARKPLRGAIVQIITADTSRSFSRGAIADSLGRFMIGDVPNGRYLIGFLHPLMDSLGLKAPVRELRVDGLDPVHANLGVPSPATIRTAVCGRRPGTASGALIVGIVRDARNGAPMGGASVTGQWLELSFQQRGAESHIQRLVATTGPTGWFALCNVPSPGTLALRADSGADSTGLIDIPTSVDGFARRDMYIGNARSTGTIRGAVMTADGGRPLAGAQVRVSNGPSARTDEGGHWTLTGVRVGTQMLEIGAVGYYPERRAVNIIADALPVHATLSTMKAALDTAQPISVRFSGTGDTAFERRRRSGSGVYLTSDDIAQAQPSVTSDLFPRIRGVRVDASRNLLVNGAAGWCSPAIFIDDVYTPHITADGIDAFVPPRDIASIEVYARSYAAPVQFRNPEGDCGSMAISTKERRVRRP